MFFVTYLQISLEKRHAKVLILSKEQTLYTIFFKNLKLIRLNLNVNLVVLQPFFCY